MSTQSSTAQALLAENAGLRARLEEAEDALHAIRDGEVEALVIATPAGPQVFTLQGLDAKSNRLRGEMLAQVGDSVIVVDGEQRVTFNRFMVGRELCMVELKKEINTLCGRIGEPPRYPVG